MPRRVKGPNGVVRVFPDDATDAEISAALEESDKPRSSPESADPSGSYLHDVGKSLTGMGRGAVLALKSAPGAVADAASTLATHPIEGMKSLADAPAAVWKGFKHLSQEAGPEELGQTFGGLMATEGLSRAIPGAVRAVVKDPAGVAGSSLKGAGSVTRTVGDFAPPALKPRIINRVGNAMTAAGEKLRPTIDPAHVGGQLVPGISREDAIMQALQEALGNKEPIDMTGHGAEGGTTGTAPPPEGFWKLNQRMGWKVPSDVFVNDQLPPRAKYVGGQPTSSGPDLDLFNVEGGPLDRSTVSEQTLKKSGIRVPSSRIPDPRIAELLKKLGGQRQP